MTSLLSASRIAEVRMLYCDTTVSVDEIARRIGVAPSTINRLIRQNGWPLRGNVVAAMGQHIGDDADPAMSPTPVNPPQLAAAPKSNRKPPLRRPKMKSLVDRLYRVIVHNLEQMETRMSDDGNSAGDNPEREARAIGNIVRSIEKLKELEPDHAKPDASTRAKSRYPLTPAEEDRLRDEIVERLLKLRERHRASNPGG